jgi:putative endonuclease
MTNKPRGTLYIGVTNDIERRGNEHFMKQGSKFTQKYNLHKLVFLEEASSINDAIAREKQLKNWHRQWKLNLIETNNPKWIDLLQPQEILKQVQDDRL